MTKAAESHHAPSVTGESQLVRGGLYAFLIVMVLVGVYGSWRSLFAFDPVMTVVYSLAGLAGLWGSWHIFRSERRSGK